MTSPWAWAEKQDAIKAAQKLRGMKESGPPELYNMQLERPAGDAEGFATWAKSKPCRDEVAGVPDGRLFALIDGYLVNVEAQSGLASATVANGKGSVVWASGNYYVGEIKDGKSNGTGTWTGADGAKYVGQFKDAKEHGEGTYTDANGDKYVGQFKDDMFQGRGTYTFANGEVLHGEFENGQPKE